MVKLISLALGTCAFVLQSCTTTTPTEPVRDLSPQAKIYAEYLKAGYAGKIGDVQNSARFHAQAFSLRPGDKNLAQKAVIAAHIAGQNDLALKQAKKLLALDKDDAFAKAVISANLIGKHNYAEADKVLTPAKTGVVGMEDFNTLMRGWAEVGMGETDKALQTFGDLLGGRYFELLGKLQQAKLYYAQGEYAKAEKLVDEAAKTDLAPVETVLTRVRGRLRQGKKDEALAALQAYAKANGGAASGPIRFAINALEQGQDYAFDLPPAAQASRAVTEPAFRYYAGQKQFEAAESYLRLAVLLDAKNDKAKLFLATVLEQIDRKDEALALFKTISMKSPYSVSARLSEADIYFDRDAYETGVKILKSIESENPSRVMQSSLGRAYLIMDDYKKALPYYDAMIKDMSLPEQEADPTAHYLRGISLERLGRWEEAVKDFEFVLKNKPDNADALNYLGYTWVDKGVNLDKAFKMIEKAVQLEPNSGAFIDSLGWAHYKLGRLGQARKYLEEAAELSPTSATIIDHLGDVYWKFGRLKEARYQWQRALGLDPTEKEKKDITAKLKGGLKSGSPAKKSGKSGE